MFRRVFAMLAITYINSRIEFIVQFDDSIERFAPSVQRRVPLDPGWQRTDIRSRQCEQRNGDRNDESRQRRDK